MKTLLIILLTVSSFCIFGQNLTLHSYSPERLCACDSVQIHLKWKQGSYPVNMKVGNLQTNQSNNVFVAILTPQDFAAMSQYAHGPDVVYVYNLKMPCDITSSQPTPISDITLIEVTFGMAISHVYVTVTDCVSGIDEYQLDSQKPVYFDLRGNRIEKRTNEVIIKQVGSKRIKTLIYE